MRADSETNRNYAHIGKNSPGNKTASANVCPNQDLPIDGNQQLWGSFAARFLVVLWVHGAARRPKQSTSEQTMSNDNNVDAKTRFASVWRQPAPTPSQHAWMPDSC